LIQNKNTTKLKLNHPTFQDRSLNQQKEAILDLLEEDYDYRGATYEVERYWRTESRLRNDNFTTLLFNVTAYFLG
jgi:hypothetical protein